jgi:hypothetical protein
MTESRYTMPGIWNFMHIYIVCYLVKFFKEQWKI